MTDANDNNIQQIYAQKLFFKSPRIDETDSQVFSAQASNLEEYEDRHKHLSELAGAHKQDPTILRIGSSLTPEALKSGMPPQAAMRVLSVHLPAHGELPDWLDVLQSTFSNVTHLYLDQQRNPNITEKDARLVRLYILYRMPQLVSIDERPVTVAERKLARPQDPNGKRVHRHEWLPSSLLDKDEMEEDDSSSVYATNSELLMTDQTQVFSPNRALVRESPLPLRANDDVEEKKSDTGRREPTSPEYYEDTGSSTAGCEWNVACGSLSFVRRPARFRLKFRRNQAEVSTSSSQPEREQVAETGSTAASVEDAVSPEAASGNLSQVCTTSTLLTESQKLSLSPNLSPLRSPKPGDARPATPSRPRSRSVPKTPPQQSRILSEPYTPGRSKASQSLTSPFPMQFRARAVEAYHQSPSRLSLVPLVRARSSPSKLNSRQTRWKSKLLARRNSIMEDVDDEVDESEGEGHDERLVEIHSDDECSYDEYSV